MRVNLSDLETLVNHLNLVTGNCPVPYKKNEEGRRVAQIGNFHISQAYGGCALYQMVTEGGGIRDVLDSGHVKKKDLYNRMCAFRRGLEVENDNH